MNRPARDKMSRVIPQMKYRDLRRRIASLTEQAKAVTSQEEAMAVILGAYEIGAISEAEVEWLSGEDNWL